MSFTGNEDHDISLSTASQWTKNFRDTVDPSATIAEFFSKTAILEVLNQENCVGIRIYNSIDNAGKKHFILCGVKANEDDIYTGKLLEDGFGSPPFSGAANALNS